MEKAQYVIGEDTVRVTIPIVKSNIDESRRIVSGWATIDNVDQTGDLVTADASLEAFKSFRGNVREMHDDKKAVGRIVHFEQREYTDAQGEVHKGIYVDVYVSKGAEDTWQKVLDGTLSAFSIKGPIRNAGMVKSIDSDALVRVITKYDLIELSLVDNPGNELCDVISVEKANTGIAANVTIDNVFWCENDKIAISHTDEVQKCVMCSAEMENIGWFEPSEDEAPNQSITKVLQAANKLEKTLDITRGGSNSEMSDNVEQEATQTDTEVTEEVTEVTEEAPVEEKVEESTEEVSEDVETADEPDLAAISKALNDIQTALSESTERTREQTVAEIQKAVSAVEKSVDARLNELLEKHSALETEVKSYKDSLGNVEKKLGEVLGTVEKASAIQKSLTTDDEGDLQKSKSEQSLWSGRFLPNSYDQN